MRVLVCGGRNYEDRLTIWGTLDELNPTLLIHGGCEGADMTAGLWANSRGIPCMAFQAAWSKFARSAGPIRNQWMLDFGKPDMVIAFPGGKGTASMIRLARNVGIEVREIK